MHDKDKETENLIRFRKGKRIEYHLCNDPILNIALPINLKSALLFRLNMK